MSATVEWLDRRLYPTYRDNWDDWLFRDVILGQLRPDSVVLDLGAGAGILQQMNFRGRAARVYGVDPDARVATNPSLDEGCVGVGEDLPYRDGQFDLVFADNVLEHLVRPVVVFREVARVLKPGGAFVVKTPNRRHYMPVAARVTSHAFHQLYNRWRGRAEFDTFPTPYRANTPEAVRSHAANASLEVTTLDLIEGRPEYLRLAAPTYLAGACYERAVNALPFLARYRILIIAVLRKPSS